VARRFRRSHSRRSSSSRSRKTRWLGAVGSITTDLETNLASGFEWVSFWAKWPASLSSGGTLTSQQVPSNEPVDETLVRTILDVSIHLDPAGSAGTITPVNSVFGLIPFDGGEYPDFYDFATFQDGVSAVAAPHPIINGDDDWIIRDTWPMLLSDSVYTLPGTDLYNQSRSKRKLPAGRGILAVFAPLEVRGSSPQTHGFNIGFDIRMAVRTGFSI